jgi:hypothetical protein
MNKRKDATVTPSTIRTGMVNPLDVMVTSQVVQQMQSVLSRVVKTRRSDSTINLLQSFKETKGDFALLQADSIVDAVAWLQSSYPKKVSYDPSAPLASEAYGVDVYSNVRNLMRSRYLRSRSEEYGPGDIPYLMITAKGIAYLYFHGELNITEFLNFLITGNTVSELKVPADTSDKYLTKWDLVSDLPSYTYLDDVSLLDGYRAHLVGSDSAKYVRNISDAVFSRNAGKAWSALGALQLPVARMLVHGRLPEKVAESYLKDSVLPYMGQPKKLIQALADTIDMHPYDSKVIIEEEILRVAWELLKRAGDVKVGLADAWEETTEELNKSLEEFETAQTRINSVITAAALDPGSLTLVWDDEDNLVVTRSDGHPVEMPSHNPDGQMADMVKEMFKVFKSMDPDDLMTDEERLQQLDEYHADLAADMEYDRMHGK